MNRHDVDGALSLVAEDFELRFEGSSASMSRDDLRDALEWDAAVNGRSHYEIESRSTSTVIVRMTERNEFFALIGIDELRSLNRFEVDEEGRIRAQRTEILDGQPSWMEEMRPAIEWSRTHQPDALAEIYDQGMIVYNGESARRWLSLLRKWRADVE